MKINNRSSEKSNNRSREKTKGLDRNSFVFLACVVVLLVIIQLLHSAVWTAIMTTVAIAAIAAMALTVLVGWAGQPSLLAGASLLVGGVCAAAIPGKTPGSFLLALILSIVLGGTVGAIAALPSRRLAGTYLLLSTMALQFIIVDVVDYVQSKTDRTGGYSLASPNLFVLKINTPSLWLWVAGLSLIFTYVYLFHLRHTRVGRSLVIIRDDSGAAAVAGVRVSSHLRWVFIVTSALISMAGVLGGYYTQNVTYESFGVLVSISFFVMIVLGGPGSLIGAALGCAFVVGMPQLLPLIYNAASQSTTLPYAEQLIYGLIGMIVLVLRFGKVPTLQRISKAFASKKPSDDTSPLFPFGQVFPPSAIVQEISDGESIRADLSFIGTNGGASTDAAEWYPEGDRAKVLSLSNLHVSYKGSVSAVRGVDLSLFAGQAISVVGPNGAGKTSVLSAVAGFYEGAGGHVSEGQVLLFDGEKQIILNDRSPAERGRLGIAFVPAEDKVFNELFVHEHFRLATPRKMSSAESSSLQEELFEVFPEVKPLSHRRAGLLSGGQRQQLAVMCALMRKPRILIVDELSLGLSPVANERLVEALLRIKALGTTSLLLAEQNVSLAFSVSDLVVTMSGGVIKSVGKPTPDFEESVRLEFVGARSGPSSQGRGLGYEQ